MSTFGDADPDAFYVPLGRIQQHIDQAEFKLQAFCQLDQPSVLGR
jgi:hypothetical protein